MKRRRRAANPFFSEKGHFRFFSHQTSGIQCLSFSVNVQTGVVLTPSKMFHLFFKDTKAGNDGTVFLHTESHATILQPMLKTLDHWSRGPRVGRIGSVIYSHSLAMYTRDFFVKHQQAGFTRGYKSLSDPLFFPQKPSKGASAKFNTFAYP